MVGNFQISPKKSPLACNEKTLNISSDRQSKIELVRKFLLAQVYQTFLLKSIAKLRDTDEKKAWKKIENFSSI